MQTINEARNVLFLVILVPIQVVLSIVFLYQVLSWSAFVGMGFVLTSDAAAYMYLTSSKG